MESGNEIPITRRELIERSSLAAGALLLPEVCATAGTETENATVSSDAPLPAGVKAIWDPKSAYSEKTPTRERICLNGLWRWQPALSDVNAAHTWGYFKVPGSWPGITDYMHKDCQTIFSHPEWKDVTLGDISMAWYQREFTVPATWAGRRIAIAFETLNSLATVIVDGKGAGEVRFPGGELDLTSVCRPGATHLLTVLVTALPLQAVMLSYTDTAGARQVKGQVERRGLCGDVTLLSTPRNARIGDVKVDTSVRQREIAFDVALEGLSPGASYRLTARIREQDGGAGNRVVREFTSRPFRAGDLKDGRITFQEKWKPDKLWDLHTPQHQYTIQMSLTAAGPKVLDVAHPVRFGFREFWIDGRDFYLNGTRLFLSAIPIDNAQVGAAWASYEGARETMARMKSFGINFVYTHNYGCEPGAHLSFAEILRAADDAGMLVALSQPHFSHYEWTDPDADRTNGYARHAEYYVRAAQNRPSVVAYAMSHNATGYVEDMNPDMIDGIAGDRDSWAQKNLRLALRAETIVKRFDTSRVVYHHSSGNLGSMHTANFYVNFTPIQELSDWFEHWAAKGVKPAFLCEYGVPFSWDWTMYRGWYNGKREWGSAVVPWEYCLAEWNAQFYGDRAYKISDRERANLRWEAAQFRAGKLWHRWDYPTQVGSSSIDEQFPVFASYITDNWRAYRTWGLSAFSPWEHSMYWRLREGVDKTRKPLSVDWSRLQRPGFSPDYLEDRPEDRLLAFDRADWVPTEAATAVIRNNRPLLAYIGGKPARFTSKDHNFLEGETIEKQLVVINNSRATVTAECSWTFHSSTVPDGTARITIPAGDQSRVPIRLKLPAGSLPGERELGATVRFSTGEVQQDTFKLHVAPPLPTPTAAAKIALFDPAGETSRLFDSIGVKTRAVNAGADLSGFDILVVGKGALTMDGPAPDVRRVRQGLKVIVFEQRADVLERRFGFRIAEYGLRQAYPRMKGHPLLAGLDAEHLRDWRGEATISTPRLKYEIADRMSPQVKWCGMDVTRVWRCGCRGNVASILIEKPARGDFMPIIDGGYSLQYSPLMEFREGQGMALFCQMDVTGRTEEDPVAERLLRNVIGYAASWKPGSRRTCLYAGDPAGKAHLEAAGFAPADLGKEIPGPQAALVLGPGAGRPLDAGSDAVRGWLRTQGRLLAIGLDEAEANAFLSAEVRTRRAEHIAAFFDAPEPGSWLAGVCPADVHNRDPREIPLITAGATPVGDGVLAHVEQTNVVFSQLAPWKFDQKKQMNLKRTFRRVSFLTTRLLSNMGVESSTPLLDRFSSPVSVAERRWLDGLYLDTPEEWDDPYRFFGW